MKEENGKTQDYKARYKATHRKTCNIDLTDTTDADIIAKLASVPNKAGYIKSLIRADMAREAAQPSEKDIYLVMFKNKREVWSIDSVHQIAKYTSARQLQHLPDSGFADYPEWYTMDFARASGYINAGTSSEFTVIESKKMIL